MLVTTGNEDTIDAGEDTDTLVLSGVVPGDHVVVVDLSSATDQVVSIGGVADPLTQINFENLTATAIGSSVNVTGSDDDNIIIGSQGNDNIDGGAGNDSMTGRAGDDTYTVDSAGDVVTEALNGGTDTVLSSMTYTLGADLENLTLTGGDDLNGTGNALANILTGNDGDNILTGKAGKDQLMGEAGNDTLLGGGGRDTVQGGAGDDLILLANTTQFATGEVIDGGADTDTLRYTGTVAATLTLTNLVTNIEQVEIADAAGLITGLTAINVNAAAVTSNGMTLVGNSGANVLTGTGFDDVLVGNAGNDTLNGGEGADMLAGGAGADNQQGGTGNDLFLLASVAEFAAGERINGGTETDTLRYTGTVAATLTLTARVTNIEEVQLADAAGDASGTAAINLNAAAVTNSLIITGNAGNNVLTGTAQADTITGGAGMDALNGGGGDDTFGLAPLDYVAGEIINGGNGADTIRLTSTGQTLDLTVIPEADLLCIEIIDLTGGDNSLNLAVVDVLAINSTHTLRVDGNAGDSVNAGSGWSFDSFLSDGGQTYAQFVQGGAVLQIDTDISHGLEFAIQLSTLNGTNGFQLSGEATHDFSGWSVSSAGDVNGDGFADLLIGAPHADPHGSESGASYVVFGQAGGFGANLNLSSLDGTNGFQLSGEAAGDGAGNSVSGAGDVNGDGFDDLLVGATAAGASYVVFGKASGFAANLNLSALDGTNGFRLSGAGSSVSGAGDVNGDGFADLLIGASYADGARYADPNGYSSGASYVVFGQAGGFGANLNLSSLDGTNGFQLSGGSAVDFSSWSVSAAGDVNGDGFGDLLIGVHAPDPSGNTPGASYVVFGFNTGHVDFPGTSGNDLLTGNSNANILIGGLGNDTLTGGTGDDRLAGGLGNDLYQINRGDGQDTISESDSPPLGNRDTLLYGATITPLDLVLSRQVNNLRIALQGTTDHVMIDNWYADPQAAQIETIQAGGQTLLNTQVDQLRQAMAVFSTQTGVSWEAAAAGGGTAQQQAEFQNIIAANWQF